MKGTASHKRRVFRTVGSLVVTGLALAYLVHSIDFHKLGEVLRSTNVALFVAAFLIVLVTVIPMGWRWQRLLAARGIHERLPWLLRAYFVAYMAGQVLPTGVGGDAMRILETSRRHDGNGGPIAATVLLERALGGAATLILAAIGFLLAVGHYDVTGYIWVEAAFVVATVALGILVFSRRARGPLRRTLPLARFLRLERPLRGVYEGVHAYREHAGLLIGVTVLTVAIQAARVLSIWLTGKAVGVDLSPRPYFVLGPLLFLVMLVPFTVNGLAVREAFFVSFLTGLGVSAEAAFATGFLFFLITLLISLPGGIILGWESLRGIHRARQVEGGG